MNNAHPDLLIAVRGLKSLKVSIADYDPSTMGPKEIYDIRVDNSKACRESLEAVLTQAMLVEKDTVYRPSRNFPRLVEWANLDIDGEGRLGDDRKPGFIASRTRQSTKNFSRVDALGVIPKDTSPKYNIDGDLSWGKLKSRYEYLSLDQTASRTNFRTFDNLNGPRS